MARSLEIDNDGPPLRLRSPWWTPCTIEWYKGTIYMIDGFRDDWLRAFFVEDIRSRRIPAELEDRLFRKLQMLDDATADQDLRTPPGNHFEKMRGSPSGYHSIRVTQRWRLVFQWDSGQGKASDVYLDGHSYR